MKDSAFEGKIMNLRGREDGRYNGSHLEYHLDLLESDHGPNQ